MADLYDKAEYRTRLKLWTIEHFKILPTDERFKELSEETMELLFLSYLHGPFEEELKVLYYAEKSGAGTEEGEGVLTEELLKNLGYDEKDIKEINEAIAKID